LGLIVLWIVIGLVFLGGLAGVIFAESGSKWVGGVIMVVALIAEAFAVIFGCMTSIGSSDIGVITSFGKPAGDLSPGVHWLSPTANVTIWDGSIQKIDYGRDNCLQVKIGGGQNACITLTLTYRIKGSAVDNLFIHYRTQQNVNDLLVTRELDQAINTKLQDYSPIDEVAKGSKNPTSMVPFIKPIIQQMQADIGGDIEITNQSLVMPYVTFDNATTNRLNAYQTQKVDTLIAQEAEVTSIAQAKALENLQNSTAKDPNAIADWCFTNIMAPVVKAGGNPAGIQCWPGGSSPNVVINPGH
jgi:SPFH domain / Band 7 family